MIKLIKPCKPIKIIKTEINVYDNSSVGLDEQALIDFIDINKIDKYIIRNIPDYDGSYTKIYYEEQIENPNYELQLKEYEKELKKYNLKLRNYNKDKDNFLKKEKQDKINKLKKELEILEKDL